METWQIILIIFGSITLFLVASVLFYKHFFKRFYDFILSLIAIIILLPVYFILSITVLIGMGHPILFSQERIGKNEKIFRLYKFRSMTNKKDKNGNLLPEKDRLTKFGIALRSTSLDELPELFMILIGKMSFVGPRPQPKFYGPYYTDEERISHEVRGGLIPPDSLTKKCQISWEEQLEIETYYAKNVSLLLDVKVIFNTFIILVKRLKENYGADDRPMLHIYRKNWEISDDVKKYWENK